jgi:hypothetical protein
MKTESGKTDRELARADASTFREFPKVVNNFLRFFAD